MKDFITKYWSQIGYMISVILLVGVGSINIQAQRTYTYHFDPAVFHIETDWDGSKRVASDTMDYNFNPEDEYCVLYKTVSYAIPFGTTTTKVTVTGSEKKLFQENIILAPPPEIYEMEPIYPNRPENIAFSNNINDAPEVSFWTSFVGNNLIPVAHITLCPFVYDEDTHNLYFIEDFTISIEVGEKKYYYPASFDQEKVEKEVYSSVENKDEVPALVHEGMVKHHLEDVLYYHLFNVGKEWIMCHFAESPSVNGGVEYNVHSFITVKVDGVKEIDDIRCKHLTIDVKNTGHSCNSCCNWLYDGWRMWQDNSENFKKYDFYTGIPKELYVYEKDRKIYFYRNPGIRFTTDKSDIEQSDPYFDLLMDLNVSVGDRWEYKKDFNFYLGTIETDDFIEIDSKRHRRITTISDYTTNDWDRTEWIEGIGCPTGFGFLSRYDSIMFPQRTEMKAPYYQIMQVKDNGKVIYDRSEILAGLGLDISTGIQHVENDSESVAAPAKYFNLQGVEVKNPTAGIYVKVADGKASKFVIK